MKSVLFATVLSLSAPVVLAQDNASAETTSYPVWTISKPVQKLQFKSSGFKDARLYTGNAWMLTKDVHRLQVLRNERLQSHAIGTGITPSSVISKGVARIQCQNR